MVLVPSSAVFPTPPAAFVAIGDAGAAVTAAAVVNRPGPASPLMYWRVIVATCVTVDAVCKYNSAVS